ncbi:MAG: hypothetical protein J6M91_04645 [Methanobrevibacter sp.]|nr:hypothetical protein [Methanobrevibacter sp.]
MSTDIFDFPPVERKYVAVRRYIITIGGVVIFNKLLKHLDLTKDEFINLHGEELISNPALFNKEIVEIIQEDFRSVRKKCLD